MRLQGIIQKGDRGALRPRLQPVLEPCVTKPLSAFNERTNNNTKKSPPLLMLLSGLGWMPFSLSIACLSFLSSIPSCNFPSARARSLTGNSFFLSLFLRCFCVSFPKGKEGNMVIEEGKKEASVSPPSLFLFDIMPMRRRVGQWSIAQRAREQRAGLWCLAACPTYSLSCTPLRGSLSFCPGSMLTLTLSLSSSRFLSFFLPVPLSLRLLT